MAWAGEQDLGDRAGPWLSEAGWLSSLYKFFFVFYLFLRDRVSLPVLLRLALSSRLKCFSHLSLPSSLGGA